MHKRRLEVPAVRWRFSCGPVNVPHGAAKLCMSPPPRCQPRSARTECLRQLWCKSSSKGSGNGLSGSGLWLPHWRGSACVGARLRTALRQLECPLAFALLARLHFSAVGPHMPASMCFWPHQRASRCSPWRRCQRACRSQHPSRLRTCRRSPCTEYCRLRQ